MKNIEFKNSLSNTMVGKFYIQKYETEPKPEDQGIALPLHESATLKESIVQLYAAMPALAKALP